MQVKTIAQMLLQNKCKIEAMHLLLRQIKKCFVFLMKDEKNISSKSSWIGDIANVSLAAD